MFKGDGKTGEAELLLNRYLAQSFLFKNLGCERRTGTPLRFFLGCTHIRTSNTHAFMLWKRDATGSNSPSMGWCFLELPSWQFIAGFLSMDVRCSNMLPNSEESKRCSRSSLIYVSVNGKLWGGSLEDMASFGCLDAKNYPNKGVCKGRETSYWAKTCISSFFKLWGDENVD